jgi:glycosyltransferase involved in cell wall biosynthesis
VDGVGNVVPPDAAILVPPHDPEAVATAIGRALHDHGLADRLSRLARTAASAWTPERMLADYRRYYAAVCAQERAIRHHAPPSRP